MPPSLRLAALAAVTVAADWPVASPDEAGIADARLFGLLTITPGGWMFSREGDRPEMPGLHLGEAR